MDEGTGIIENQVKQDTTLLQFLLSLFPFSYLITFSVSQLSFYSLVCYMSLFLAFLTVKKDHFKEMSHIFIRNKKKKGK